ncbi:hypothetical protein O1611_g316 [Lasiodiplodia mahajangana]|uniref:Uncharacterized protein n=1 Tax=Lasiodiplodia mahajangana TaxID=1108764 RepID=A0ACC2K1J1_9PEZI|nr:hypothetical protein O1611_g316 [Lasiodiplodia mahajangana]
MRRHMSSVTITDPLVKYHSLLATGSCSPDPAQHRLALHLQKVYHRLKDYSPSVEYRTRLRAITSALNDSKEDNRSLHLASESHPIRRNPLLARFFARTRSTDTLALTRVLTSHEEAIHIDSPQGLFLSGEVGTGKSMLLDLLAEGLPTSQRHRKMQSTLGNGDEQYSLLWMAKEMIEKSPILFLDEFQLPDRAASKILSGLFAVFFQLGGVLIASSNRMPEELEKATGCEYIAPAASLLGRALAFGKASGRGDLFGSSSEFASFLRVLKARCELWQMEGAKDWRRRDFDHFLGDGSSNLAPTSLSEMRTEAQAEPPLLESLENASEAIARPKEYYLADPDYDLLWNAALSRHRVGAADDVAWKTDTITVYGRTVYIPKQCNGVVLWDFQDLVSSFGPADYITMASTYHSFIIDNIPILVLLKKNEARRLITLLDALYEARCKLIVRAAVGPDDLFFPDAQHTITSVPQATSSSLSDPAREQVDADAIHSETIAEAYQDQMSPFRPNISSYADSNNTEYDPDQDSDFSVDPKKSKVDFSNTGAFTGEDERFAYKRATSRLWELCSERWHARKGDWWQPLPIEARHWEGGQPTRPRMISSNEKVSGDVTMGPSTELEEPAGLQKLRVKYLSKTINYDK